MGEREGMALGLYLELRRQDRFEGRRTSQPCQRCAEASMCSCGNIPGTRSTTRRPAPVPCVAPEPRSAAPGSLPSASRAQSGCGQQSCGQPTHGTGTARVSPEVAEDKREASGT